MPKFRYEAIDRLGVNVTGEIDSASQDSAVSQLSNAGMTPLTIRADRPGLALLARGSKPPAERDIALLTRKLAALLRAGLTLDRGLMIVRDLSEPSQRRLVEELLQRIKAGASFSDALADKSELFAPDYIGMVRAGEFSGALPETLSRLAQMLERRLEIRQRLASTLTYPAILLGMMVVTVVVVVTVVLPRLESLFAEAQAELPLATRAVLACGHFLQDYGWALLVALLAGAALTLRMLKRPALRLKVDRLLLQRRPWGQFISAMEFARFSRVLGTLLGGGVALSVAFRLALPSVRNSALLEDLRGSLLRVREGSSLADELTKLRVTPPILANLTSVGLQTGQLDRMLVEAADLLDSELGGLTERYLALLVPLLTIVMGLLVAGLIASVLVGILSVNDLAL